ncbi:MAG: VOC family protein [Bacteroidia bacterium]
MIQSIHHIALICSDYQKSKYFYINILGLTAGNEVYRKERQSMKLDLYLNEQYVLELFTFPNPPERRSYPEACGLRHLAFSVSSLDKVIQNLRKHAIDLPNIRIDEYTGKRFMFISDPDGMPIEFYEEELFQ